MKVKIAANFHVFVPKDGRDRRVAFTAGTAIGPDDMPAGHSMQDWVEKGLAVAVDTDGAGNQGPEAEDPA